MTESSVPSASPSPYPTAPSHYGAAPSPSHRRTIEVQERPFVIGLLLTIVTLGIYHFVWHALTHEELHRQMGRENGHKGLFWAYVAVTVFPLFIVIFLVIQFVVFLVRIGAPEPSEAQIFRFVMEFIVWIILLIVLGIVGMVLYALYVLRQWELVKEAKARMGLQLRGSAGLFLGLWFGGIAVNTFTGIPAHVVMGPIAYYFLQENYNDFPRALRHAQVDPAQYGPGAPGWQSGPTRPPAPGPAPIVPGYAQGHATPQYGEGGGPAQYPTAYGQGGMQRGSWDVPADPDPSSQEGAAPRASRTTEGFSIRERGTTEEGPTPTPSPYAPETPLVEQSFQCPKCHSHVPARGAPGEAVTIHCPRCQETGTVRMPEL